jgi:hypothetical protein
MLRVIDKPFVWAALAIVLVLGGQSLTVHANYDGNWTGLFRTGSDKEVPRSLRADTFRSAHPSGYDGQFYRYLSHDPLLRNGTAAYLDNPALRARRMLVPLLVWTLAGGRHEAIDGAYILFISASVFAGVYFMGLIMAHHGRSPSWGLSFLTVPAVLIGIDTMTIDVVFAALVACFAWQIQTGRRRWLWLTVAAAPLVRDTGLILVAACAVAALTRRDWRKAAYWMTAAVPLMLWSGYLQAIFPETATTSQAILPWWYFPKLRLGVALAFVSPADYPNLSASVEILVRLLDRVCLLGIMSATILGALRLRAAKWEETTLALGVFTALVPALSSRGVWLSPYGYSRLISPLFVLLLVAYGAKLRGPAFAAAVTVCLMVDLRLSAEVLTQFLGILHWLGWN